MRKAYSTSFVLDFKFVRISSLVSLQPNQRYKIATETGSQGRGEVVGERRDRAWSARDTNSPIRSNLFRKRGAREARREGGLGRWKSTASAEISILADVYRPDTRRRGTCTAKLQLPRSCAPPYLAVAFTPLPSWFSSTVHARPSN